jgi:4-oxalocrotonate tautomerase
MPLVRITLRKGKSDPFLDSAGRAIHAALVEAANAPADGLFQVWDEVDASRLVAHPAYGGVDRSGDLMIIEITLNAGRTIEVKRALYAAIVERLGALGVRPDDVVINLVEVSKENWSFGKGRSTYVE